LEKAHNFKIVVAKLLVFGQNDPAILAYYRQPVYILCVRREVVGLDFNAHAMGAKRIRNNMGAKALVYEERWLMLRPGG